MTPHPILPPDDTEVEKALVTLNAEQREAAEQLASNAIREGGPIMRTEAMRRRVWLTAAAEAARVSAPPGPDPPRDRSERKVEKRPIRGREVTFPEIEAWPDPVMGAALLDDIIGTFRRFLSLPEGAAEAITLWAVFAHAHDCFTISPLLAFTSPAKRCGKTTALQITGEIVPRPLHAANVTAAAVFRAIDRYCPTLLVDEADTFLSEKNELRGVLNSGHSKRSARLIRTVGDHHEVRAFSTWAPKAVALIGALPDTLADRSIAITMKRRARGERLQRLRGDRLDELQHLARKAATWAAGVAPALRLADPDVPGELDDRAADNWRPLLAIADEVGGDWPQRARRAAVILSGGRNEDSESIRTQLLADARQVFDDRGTGRLASKDLAEALRGLEDRPWADWARGKGLSPNGLARLLAPFEIAPKTTRLPDGGRLKGYHLDDFSDAFTRYLPPLPDRDEVTTRAGIGEIAETRTVTGDEASRFESGGSGASVRQSPGVTVQTGESGGREGGAT